MEKDIEQKLADVVTDRPKGFTVGKRHFFIWPVTLGKLYLMQRIVGLLGVDSENIKANSLLEALRIVKEHKDEVLLLLSYLTFPNDLDTSSKIYSTKLNNDKISFFKQNIEDADLASLLITCLTLDNTAEIAKDLKIDKENERMRKVSKVKDSKNTYSFGGVSVFGTLYGTLVDSQTGKIDWQNEPYLTWVVPYSKAQLILMDSVKTIYLSDKERKRVHVSNDATRINGDDKEAMTQLLKANGTEWN